MNYFFKGARAIKIISTPEGSNSKYSFIAARKRLLRRLRSTAEPKRRDIEKPIRGLNSPFVLKKNKVLKGGWLKNDLVDRFS